MSKTAPKSIADLPGLGQKSAAIIAHSGVTSVDAFLASDPIQLYAKLKAMQISVSLNLLYAIIGAQQNRPWQDVKRTDKEWILMQLDDLGIAP